MLKHIDKRINVCDINEHNKGFVANMNIPKYTVILVEKPHKIYKTLDKMVSDMKEDIKKYKLEQQFQNLYPRNLEEDDKNYYYEKIIKNAFDFDRKKHTKPCLLFYGAIFNHSCYPNVLFTSFNEFMIFYTIRDIKKGEELTDHYIDVNKPRDIRKELLEQYEFTCNCQKCLDGDNNYEKYNYDLHHKYIRQIWLDKKNL